MKYLALFLLLFISIAINLQSGYLAVLGFHPDIMMAAVAAALLTVLTAHRKVFFVVLVVMMSIGANLPDATMQRFGLDREVLLAGLMAIVLIPYVMLMFGYDE